MSCFPVCDETTGYIPPVSPEEIQQLIPLELRKNPCGKFVCAPIVRGSEGEEGPEGQIDVNNTVFVDAEFGNGGQDERLDLPFQSLADAINSIPTDQGNWQVYLWPGTYTLTGVVFPVGISLDIRGSGPNTTIIEGGFLNTQAVTLNLANFTLNTTDVASLDARGGGVVNARDLVINNTSGLPVIDIPIGNGEIMVQDSRITHTTTSSDSFRNSSGILRMTNNQITVANTSSSEVSLIESANSFTDFSNNTIDFTVSDVPVSFYLLNVSGVTNAIMIVNDNYHTIISPGYSSTFVIYRGNGEPAGGISRLLGRNNEYAFVGVSVDQIISIQRTNGTGELLLLKVVDDTFPNLPEIPRPDPPSEVDPGNSIQYQMNSGNSLATNQGIQFATRDVSETTHTVDDDDFFINVLIAPATITLPSPNASIRGKVVIIRNSTLAGTITVSPNGDVLGPGRTIQYINNETVWLIISTS